MRASLRAASVAVLVVVSLASTIQPAVAVTPLAETDVAAFSSRAQQWTDARQAFRDAAHAQALELAVNARQAETDRLAAQAAARVAEDERLHAAEEAARTTTTTVPPTTVPPTTLPPATVAPTTVPPATVPVEADPSPATTAPPTTTQPADPGGPTAAQWEVLRQCESSSNYGIVSRNGRYRGAYQFSQATWDWVAGSALPALVGVDPAAAAPADQDAMALALWNRQGWSPWPICGAQAAAA